MGRLRSSAQPIAHVDEAAAGPSAAEPEMGEASDEAEEEVWDPYAPLDPSSPGDLPIAPFKKGRAPSNKRRRWAMNHSLCVTHWCERAC